MHSIRPKKQAPKLRSKSAYHCETKPVIPTVLKQWLDFKPNIDNKNPRVEPTEHEKGNNETTSNKLLVR
jgi:hypothetical protein